MSRPALARIPDRPNDLRSITGRAKLAPATIVAQLSTSFEQADVRSRYVRRPDIVPRVECSPLESRRDFYFRNPAFAGPDEARGTNSGSTTISAWYSAAFSICSIIVFAAICPIRCNG